MKKAPVLPLLPERIKVEIIKGTSGCLIAELSEYDASTEADSFEELEYNVNDLIYTLFDIPKSFQKKIWYQAPWKKTQTFPQKNISLMFKVFYSSDLFQQHLIQ